MTQDSIPEPILEQLEARSRHDPHADIVRLAVRLRAGDTCEYCLLSTVGQFQVDHIIPAARWLEYSAGRIRSVTPAAKRQGPHHMDNYAWACPNCNISKSDQVSRRIGRRTHRLYDPRRDRWTEHFGLFHRHLLIVGVSDIGAATIEALRMNESRLDGPIMQRHEAIVDGHYPPSWARASLVGPD